MTGPTPEQARALWAAAKAAARESHFPLKLAPSCDREGVGLVTRSVVVDGSDGFTMWDVHGNGTGAHSAERLLKQAFTLDAATTLKAILNALGPWSPVALAAVRA